MEAVGIFKETGSVRLHLTETPRRLLLEYRGTQGLGAPLRKSISERLFSVVEEAGVPVQNIRSEAACTLVYRLEVYPVSVSVVMRVDDELSRRTGYERGMRLPRPLVEFRFTERNGALLSREHIALMNVATERQVARMRRLALRASRALSRHLGRAGLELHQVLFRFGASRGRIRLCGVLDTSTVLVRDRAGNAVKPGALWDAMQEAVI